MCLRSRQGQEGRVCEAERPSPDTERVRQDTVRSAPVAPQDDDGECYVASGQVSGRRFLLLLLARDLVEH